MIKFLLILIFILWTMSSFGTTVYLRKGGTVEGEIISKDDEKFVVKTADGEKTIKWRQLTNKSIKEINPVLYEKLKKQALEKKIKKNEKNNKVKKNDIDFSRIHLSVVKTEKGGAYKKIDIDLDIDKYSSSVKREWKSIRFYEKECYGKINIKLNGLDSKKKYYLKTIYSHYIKNDENARPFAKKTSSEKNIVKTNNFSGEISCDIDIISSPFYCYKEKLKSGCQINEDNKIKKEYGDKADGWDISIWLNDILIYEEINRNCRTPHNGILYK